MKTVELKLEELTAVPPGMTDQKDIEIHTLRGLVLQLRSENLNLTRQLLPVWEDQIGREGLALAGKRFVPGAGLVPIVAPKNGKAKK